MPPRKDSSGRRQTACHPGNQAVPGHRSHCVGDEIDRQIEAIDRVIGRLPGVRGREAPR